MPEPTLQEISQQSQEPQKPVEQVTDPQQKTSDDLLSRVTQYEVENKPDATQIENKDVPFDYNELNNIENAEQAKEWASKAHKSFQRGVDQKFQELAELRKALQANLQSGNKEQEGWTRDRIQKLVNDEEFVKAAQEFQNTQAEDDFSTLSDTEKKSISDMRFKLEAMEKANQQSLIQQQQLERQRYHEQFTAKYANYKSDEIDKLSIEIASGRLNATPEHIYKAFKHDENMEKAYQLGRQDEREGINENVNALSIEGHNTFRSEEPIERKEGESSESVWARASAKALAAVTGNAAIKK